MTEIRLGRTSPGGVVSEMAVGGSMPPVPPGTGDPIRVLVVDDHALFRRGLEMVLEQEPDIDVVGEAEDGAEALQKAVEATPDIVLMDVRMPQRGGIDACTPLKDAVPPTKLIMLTISDEE